MKKLMIVLLCISFFSCKQDKEDSGRQAKTIDALVSGQSLNRVEPPNWWVGMKNDSLQLLVHHDKIGNYKPGISYKGVRIENFLYT